MLVEFALLHVESLKYPLISRSTRPAVQVCRVSPYQPLRQTSFSWQSLPGRVSDNQGFRLLGAGGLTVSVCHLRHALEQYSPLSVTRAFVGGTLFRAYFRAPARHLVMLTFRSAMFVLSYDPSFHVSLLCQKSHDFMSFAFRA
jgi:hypothetical protein